MPSRSKLLEPEFCTRTVTTTPGPETSPGPCPVTDTGCGADAVTSTPVRSVAARPAGTGGAVETATDGLAVSLAGAPEVFEVEDVEAVDRGLPVADGVPDGDVAEVADGEDGEDVEAPPAVLVGSELHPATRAQQEVTISSAIRAPLMAAPPFLARRSAPRIGTPPSRAGSTVPDATCRAGDVGAFPPAASRG